jgi:hypothetical protein
VFDTMGNVAVALQDLVERTRPIALAGERVLPVLPALEAVLPGGLRRGATVTVSGSTSLAVAVLAGASQAGSWCAAVGLPSLGLVAAAELGVSLGRLALVADPGTGEEWATVTAALLDALDVVLVRPPARLKQGDARRLMARARERGSVLVAAGPWGDGAEVRLSASVVGWEGIGRGHGRLEARRVVVTAEGRGAAARPRRAELWLPGPEGTVEPAPAPASAPAPAPPSRIGLGIVRKSERFRSQNGLAG